MQRCYLSELTMSSVPSGEALSAEAQWHQSVWLLPFEYRPAARCIGQQCQLWQPQGRQPTGQHHHISSYLPQIAIVSGDCKQEIAVPQAVIANMR